VGNARRAERYLRQCIASANFRGHPLALASAESELSTA
jgi:hypothetical protein